MDQLKITCWNVEHAHRIVTGPSTASTEDRRTRVRRTLAAIDPDILCLVEGPAQVENITASPKMSSITLGSP